MNSLSQHMEESELPKLFMIFFSTFVIALTTHAKVMEVCYCLSEILGDKILPSFTTYSKLGNDDPAELKGGKSNRRL